MIYLFIPEIFKKKLNPILSKKSCEFTNVILLSENWCEMFVLKISYILYIYMKSLIRTFHTSFLNFFLNTRNLSKEFLNPILLTKSSFEFVFLLCEFPRLFCRQKTGVLCSY